MPEYVGIAFDRTEAIETSKVNRDHVQLLDLAVESAAMILILLDLEGRLLFSACKALNDVEDEPGQVIGQSVFDLIQGTTGGEEVVRRALAGEAANWEGYIFGRWYVVRLSPVRDEAGELTSVAGVAIDGTDLHESEERVLMREAQLAKILDGTVSALSSVVELRDPYTAGHQQRVMALAVAIADELGWDPRQRRALRVAALLHDVGKVMCPAEILSKPASLSEHEMALVKQHSPAGAAILSDIDFEGPVVTAVLQHHERLDGSGYPAGISGDQIIPEARVIAVADVVEAMSSHRPYRAALGLAVALDEIRSGRARLYDADVVDACVRVFGGGFTFDEPAQRGRPSPIVTLTGSPERPIR